jgi:FixJ family two-component response regulator
MTAVRPLVCVVDDDESVRESLPDLLREFGFAVEAYASADEYLNSGRVATTSCLLLDIAMPGTTGPDLSQELLRQGKSVPVIFITAHADESIRLLLIKQGAIDCLFKPFSETALLSAIRAALGTT